MGEKKENGETKVEYNKSFKYDGLLLFPRSHEEVQESIRKIEIQEIEFKMGFLCECLKMPINEYIAIWRMLLQESKWNREERLMLEVMNEMAEDFKSL